MRPAQAGNLPLAPFSNQVSRQFSFLPHFSVVTGGLQVDRLELEGRGVAGFAGCAFGATADDAPRSTRLAPIRARTRRNWRKAFLRCGRACSL